jgi:hypothetical protein
MDDHMPCQLCGKPVIRRGRQATIAAHVKQCHPELAFESIKTNGQLRQFCAICNACFGGHGNGGLEKKLLVHYKVRHPEALEGHNYTPPMNGVPAIPPTQPKVATSAIAQRPPASMTSEQVIDAVLDFRDRALQAERTVIALQDGQAKLKQEAVEAKGKYEAQSREIAMITTLNNNLRAENAELKAEITKIQKRYIIELPALQERQAIINAQ